MTQEEPNKPTQPAGTDQQVPGDQAPLQPAVKKQRLDDLDALEILDSAQGDGFVYLITTAMTLTGMPMAAIALFGEDRLWFRVHSRIGPWKLARNVTLDDRMIANPTEVLVVEDTRTDPRFADSRIIASDPRIGFYAGSPIVTAEGYAIGALCMLDNKPGSLNAEQITELRQLGRQVATLLEVRHAPRSQWGKLARERESARAKLAKHDHLTGVYNREGLLDEVDKMRASTLAREIGATSICVVDLIEFGDVNRKLGHDGGDKILQVVAEQIASTIPDRAILARTGDTVFVALLPEADNEEAQRIARAILQRLNRMISANGYDPIKIKVVIGVVTAAAGSGTELRQLLDSADDALDEAKLGGASTIATLGEPVREKLAHDAAVTRALAAVLESGGLDVYYMPLVRLEDRAVIGYEALARWTDPELGEVPTADFVRLAETHGMVGALDRIVLRQALTDFAAGRIPGDEVSVNVSPPGVLGDMTSQILEQLKATGVDPKKLVIEITERVAPGDNPLLEAALRELTKIGVRVALDDFGTGATSISSLRTLPFTRIKIDRTLTAGIEEGNPQARLVVEGIVLMATHLGLDTLAEGIETEEQAEILLEAGVAYGQGFHFGRPLPIPRDAVDESE